MTLDLLRAVAAQLVCVGHAYSFFIGAWPAGLPYIQNVGVLLFFLLSGFLITHTLVSRSIKPDYGFLQFFIDRFARIYSGLIPALMFVVAVDWFVLYLTAEPTIARYYTLKTFIANLFMLEGYRGAFPNALQWSAFGSASPLWTLAIEWHIYMFAGSVFFMCRNPRTIPLLAPVALFFGQTPVHFLFGSFQSDGVGRGLFSLWLAGAAIYVVARLPYRLPAAALLAFVSAVAFVAITPAGKEYSFVGYPLLTAVVLGIVAVTQRRHRITSERVQRTIGFFADYSFSLYLVHHTIMVGIWLLLPDRGVPVFVLAVALSNAVAIGLASIGENRHKIIARFLTGKFCLQSRHAAHTAS
ncbi:acyltransferase family protein [Bradyrhizobium sp. CCBAU 53415]|uniref:acyltransferase family protein n=1 Tax=Bradyrhizobium sp. CCBAU 53415 TaxID=1325119 RepID=UPI00230581FD|nr:acyltransferase [Bradyrhizobium sp. CCBAU 53415]